MRLGSSAPVLCRALRASVCRLPCPVGLRRDISFWCMFGCVFVTVTTIIPVLLIQLVPCMHGSRLDALTLMCT